MSEEASPEAASSPASPRKRFAWIVGEVVTIMLGVLIALAVDRAMQSVDERAFEETQLRSLLADFEEAQRVAEGGARHAKWRDQLSHTVLTVLEGEEPLDLTAAQLAQAIEFPSWHYLPEFPRAAWDDLVGTGRLASIRNAEVRRRVSAFYAGLVQIQRFHQDWLTSSRPYRNATADILPPRTRVALTAEFLYQTPPEQGAIPPLPELVARIRAQADLPAHLSHVLLANAAAVESFAELEKEAKQISELLAREIGQR